MQQINVFDIGVEKTRVLCAGDSLSQEDFTKIAGDPISFPDLKDLIGSEIICKDPIGAHPLQIVSVASYEENASVLYKRVKVLPERYKDIYADVVNDMLYDTFMPKEVKGCYEKMCSVGRVGILKNAKHKDISLLDEFCCEHGRVPPQVYAPVSFYYIKT